MRAMLRTAAPRCCARLLSLRYWPEGRQPGCRQSSAALKNELAPIQIFGENRNCLLLFVPGFAGTPARPPGAGFVFLGLVISLRHKPFILGSRRESRDLPESGNRRPRYRETYFARGIATWRPIRPLFSTGARYRTFARPRTKAIERMLQQIAEHHAVAG
jgi:hypothetical protein